MARSVALLASAAFAMGLAGRASAFSFTFFENGHGEFDFPDGTVQVNNGFMASDFTGSGIATNVLVFDLKSINIAQGDVGVLEYGSTSVLSDVVRFWDDATNLYGNGAGEDYLIFYSLNDGDGAAADTGLPQNYNYLGNAATVSEQIDGGFDYLTYNADGSVNNSYHGHSYEVPEPFTMALGLAGMGLFIRRRTVKKRS